MTNVAAAGAGVGGGGGGAHPAAGPPATDVLQERVIQSEYMIWKKNTPYLYDFVLTHSLEWPSLTCQWLPTVRSAGANAAEQSLLIGTHTTGGEQNYLMVASAVIPKDDAVVDENKNTAESTNTGIGGTVSVNNNINNNGNTTTTKSTVSNAPRYDEEKKEVGGFGHANTNVGKIEIKMKVKHEGEVNRARYMPQNHFVVATRGPNPEVYIFDVSKHPSTPEHSSAFSPQGVCIGHEKEGYGMVWSKHNEGYLLTGSEDTTVKLWDVRACTASKATAGTQIKPILNLAGHVETVEDVDWHHKDAHLVASVGDDRVLNLWDTRKKDNHAVHCVRAAHDGDINCVAFNPVNEFVLATGSADKTIAVWDMRNLKSRVQSLEGHNDQVYMVEWAPFNESILGSCSADRRVGIWDLSRIGMEQSAEDAEDGPPELLFLHGGHTSKVSDFTWNVQDQWTVASVSEDNVLQVWNMAEEIYAQEDDEEQSSGEGEDGLLGTDDLE